MALVCDDRRTLVEVRPWGAEVVDADGSRCDATLAATSATWARIAGDLRGGIKAFARGRLSVRGDLNAAIGFLAATSGVTDDARLRVRCAETRAGAMSIYTAGAGEPLLLLHGLGATKASFLPTIDALADRYRIVAVDLPGFGDSVKPIGAAYDPAYFARSAVALLDALRIRRAHILGHSLGGRVALELGCAHADRVASLSLVAPSLPWLRRRAWVPLLQVLRPELGLLDVTPRAVVEAVTRRFVPGAASGWTKTGVDEFLRAFCTPRGRAAFYAAARNIYLEEAHGETGLWRRLEALDVPCLFVWGRRDTLVPPAFARHVDRALPVARHVFVDCGHVPQFECPDELHQAIASFLADNPMPRERVVKLSGRRPSVRAWRRPVA